MAALSYHEQEIIENTKRLRQMLKELPPFCADFFRGIEPRTSSRTRIAYAYDLHIFFDFLHKEIRDTTSRTFPDKHTDNLMSFVCQLPPERQGLCQMASTLPLYDKQHFHITSAYNTGFETDSSSISYSALL